MAVPLQGEGAEEPEKFVVINKDLYTAFKKTSELKSRPRVKRNKMVERGLVVKDAMEILHNSMVSSAAKGHEYLIINHAVPVRARIFREKGPDDKKCPVCGGEEETIVHLYQDCTETRKDCTAPRTVCERRARSLLPSMY